MKKNKRRVYLAGSMAARPVWEVLLERLIARRECSFVGLASYDPAKNELEHLDRRCRISSSYNIKTMKNFVRKDEAALDRCQAVLVITGDRSSDGTSWEMARAYYHLNIPIVVVSDRRRKGKLMGFTNIKATKLVSTIKEGVDWIVEHT
jgi:nucleoside 2-deoxyribosyltransferase